MYTSVEKLLIIDIIRDMIRPYILRIDPWSSLDWSCLFCSGPWKRWGQTYERCWSLAHSWEPMGGQIDSGSQSFWWKLRYWNQKQDISIQTLFNSFFVINRNSDRSFHPYCDIHLSGKEEMEGGTWFYAVVADWALGCRRGLHGRSLSTLNDWRSPVHCKK